MSTLNQQLLNENTSAEKATSLKLRKKSAKVVPVGAAVNGNNDSEIKPETKETADPIHSNTDVGEAAHNAAVRAQKLFNHVVSEANKTASSATSAAGEAVVTVQDQMKSATGSDMNGTSAGTVQSGLDSAMDTAAEKGGEVQEGVKGTYNSTVNAASEKGSQLQEGMKGTYNAAVETVAEKGAQVQEGMKGIASKTEDFISTATSQVGEKANDLFVTMVDGGEGNHGEGPLGPNHIAQSAGEYFGAMRAQKGGIGQETEAFSRGLKSTAETAETVWNKVPDEAKHVVARGAENVTTTIEMLWVKFFRLVDHALDWTDQQLFPQLQPGYVDSKKDKDDEYSSDQSKLRDLEGHVVDAGQHAVSWFGLKQRSPAEMKRIKAEKAKLRKEKEKKRAAKWGTFGLVMKLSGGILGMLTVSMACFFLGFLLLPLVFIALFFSVVGLQVWACCGLVQ